MSVSEARDGSKLVSESLFCSLTGIVILIFTFKESVILLRASHSPILLYEYKRFSKSKFYL